MLLAPPTSLSIQIYREIAPYFLINCYVVLFCFLKEAIIYFRQNKMDNCQATCWVVWSCHYPGNWPSVVTKALNIIWAVYRQAKELGQANEYMENHLRY